jgi:hypothetical protein
VGRHVIERPFGRRRSTSRTIVVETMRPEVGDFQCVFLETTQLVPELITGVKERDLFVDSGFGF